MSENNNKERTVAGSASNVSMGSMMDLINKLNDQGFKINPEDVAVVSAQDLASNDKASTNKVKMK